MDKTKINNNGNKNRSVRKDSKRKKLSKKINENKKKNRKIKGFAKCIMLASLVLIVFKFADIKFGNPFKVYENKPVVNSNEIKKEPLPESKEPSNNENSLSNNINDKSEDHAQYTLCDVQAPKKRTDSEIYNELRKMSLDNVAIKRIYDYKELYPIALLGSLVNNPEMTQFVSGYLDSGINTSSNFRVDDLNTKNKLILQWDKRWGYETYGNSIIAVSGCAPTSLSMVISSLADKSDVTPYDISKFSEANGYYVKGFGTDWSLMIDAANRYGISASETSSAVGTMKQKLDEGQLIICTMNPGDFTAEGHFIVIYGYDESGFLVNDPNCVFRSKKSWEFKSFSSQIRNSWSYKKK